MNENSEQQPIGRVEYSHFNIAYDDQSLKEIELQRSVFGSRDASATTSFRGYRLPDQDRKSYDPMTGEPIDHVRALLDQEEYVVPVSVSQLAELVSLVKADHERIASNWDPSFGADPIKYSTYDVIFGDPAETSTAYRVRILDAHIEESPSQVTLLVEANVEHEKNKDVFAVHNPGVESDSPPDSQGVAVDPEMFSETQIDMMANPQINSKLAFGSRTGRLIRHQRAPTGMTMFFEDRSSLTIDLQKTKLWVVSVDAAAVIAYKAERYKSLNQQTN